MNHLNDEDLYARLFTAEKEVAFRCLYDRHSQFLFRFLFRFTTNKQSAEELLHDTFIQLLDSRLELNEQLNIKAWLYTIAKNKSLNHIKKRSREINNEVAISSATADGDIENQLVNENLLDRLSDLERELPKDLSLTWSLRKEGLDYRQIAEKLSIPIGTVKSRFSRLVEHLSREFKGVKNEQ